MDKLFGRLGFKNKDKAQAGDTATTPRSGSGSSTPSPSNQAAAASSGRSTPRSARNGSGGNTDNNNGLGPNGKPQSEFAKSAFEAARMGNNKVPTRAIDQHTDMRTLTDAEIVRLSEGLEAGVLTQSPLSGPFHLNTIRQEFLAGEPQVLRKIQWLEANGWDQVWRARPDGDCFYRSFTIAYLLRILYAPDQSAAAAKAYHDVDGTRIMMGFAGFQNELVDEFLAPLLERIAAFIDPPAGAEPTAFSITQALQDTEKSNSIVVALRLMTSAYIRNHRDDFANFLLSPTTFEPIEPEEFCAREVDPCGKEADQPQITALSAALHVPLRVAYLDRSEAGDDVINWVPFEGATEENRPLTLLFRPGHYDVVTKDNEGLALQAAAINRAAEDAGIVPSPVSGPSVPPPAARAPSSTASSQQSSKGKAKATSLAKSGSSSSSPGVSPKVGSSPTVAAAPQVAIAEATLDTIAEPTAGAPTTGALATVNQVASASTAPQNVVGSEAKPS